MLSILIIDKHTQTFAQDHNKENIFKLTIQLIPIK